MESAVTFYQYSGLQKLCEITTLYFGNTEVKIADVFCSFVPLVYCLYCDDGVSKITNI